MDEVHPTPFEVLGLNGTEVEDKELAKSLIDSMGMSLDRLDLKDRYHDALKEMLQAKIDGQEVVTAAEEVKPVVEITTALKECIEQAKAGKKPMKKATGEKEEAKEKKASASVKKAKEAMKARKAAAKKVA